jgi:hypothetical protein
MCREGGCGLCVVVATKLDPVTKKEESKAINSVRYFFFICIDIFVLEIWSLMTVKR